MKGIIESGKVSCIFKIWEIVDFVLLEGIDLMVKFSSSSFVKGKSSVKGFKYSLIIDENIDSITTSILYLYHKKC